MDSQKSWTRLSDQATAAMYKRRMCYREESKPKIIWETLGHSMLDTQGRSLSGAAYSKSRNKGPR